MLSRVSQNPEITDEMIDAELARQDYEARGGYAPPTVFVQRVELTHSVLHIAAGVLLANLVTALVVGLALLAAS